MDPPSAPVPQFHANTRTPSTVRCGDIRRAAVMIERENTGAASDRVPGEMRVDKDGKHGAEKLNCLVTGASGYIGGRLVPELLKAGHRVRCLARSPGKLRDYPWAAAVETVSGDVTDAESVAAAMRGIDVAYYLVHSLGSGSGFEDTDRRAARIFAERAHAHAAYGASSISAGSPRGTYPSGPSPRTCAPGPRSAASSSTVRCPPPC